MSPKRHHHDRPADAPADERRPTRRSEVPADDQLSPDEAATVPVRVLRCHWPRVWTRLVEAKANFVTTRVVVNLFDAGHVDLLIARRDAGLLGGLATRLPTARNPWPAERLAPRARDWQALDDTPGDDELDRLFRAAEKAARGQHRGGMLDPVEGAA
jgi:hypothetical protein